MPAIVLLIALLVAGYTEGSATCERKLDILLFVDGSSTVCNGTQTCPQWTSILQFCKDIVKSFKIGPDDTQVAFILMTDKVHVQWDLNQYTNVTTLLSAIDNVAYTGGRFPLLSIPSTLSILTKVFNPLLPSSGDRPKVLNVAISITDGVPDVGPLLASILSNAYQLLGIAAFDVCVRPGCNEDWVRGISSFPHKADETYFLVDGFFMLDPIRDNLVNNICPYQQKIVLGRPSAKFSGYTHPQLQLETTDRTMSNIVLLIALLATGYTNASATCGRKLDILLHVDGSSTVCNGTQTCPQWTSILEFCKNIVKSFKIGPNDTQIAFILMSDQFHVRWNLTRHTDETSLLTAIENVAYTGGVFTLLSLPSSLNLLTQVFNPSYGDRSDALNVIITITDGVPAIPALLGSVISTAYQLLRMAAFDVCVRPGCTEDWIRGISAYPHKVNETYFFVDSFFLLDPIRDNLVNKVCKYQMSLLAGLLPALL